MNNYELKLRKFLYNNKIKAKHLIFKESCHSVEKAAKTVKAKKTDFVKNICLIDLNRNLIVAILKGEDNLDISKISKFLNIKKLRLANQNEILEKTGYPCGGVPSFGYETTFLIDARVLEKNIVYTGGGSGNALIKISVQELLKANQGTIVDIKK